jgi:hypothetical protein
VARIGTCRGCVRDLLNGREVLGGTARGAHLLEHAHNRTILADLESRRAGVMFTDEAEVPLATHCYPGLQRLSPDGFESAAKTFLMPKNDDWRSVADPWLQREVAAGTPARLLECYPSHQ